MARKLKTLPKDFEDLLTSASIDELKTVFDTRLLDARGGYSKQTALAFTDVPDELVRWLVAEGLDIDAGDEYDRSPLWQLASYGRDISLLIELGADIERPDRYGTRPLHAAEDRPVPIAQLIAAGADVAALDDQDDVPIARAIRRSTNAGLEQLAPALKLLVEAGSPIPDDIHDEITRIGERFEFYRESFNPDYLAETEAALDEIYALFGTTPVPRVIRHDGTSRIEVDGTDDDDRFDKLWDFLVPGSGPAQSVQGEVIRIAGKVNDELLRNGAGNWDTNFRKMLDALGEHLSSGTTVGDADELAALITQARSGKGDDVWELVRWSSRWVDANRNPVKLPKPAYKR